MARRRASVCAVVHTPWARTWRTLLMEYLMITVPIPRIAAFAVFICLASPAVGRAQARVNPQAAALADFSRRVADYLALEKRVTADLPPLKKTDDPVEISGRELAIGAAVRAARAGARQGDVMTSAVAKIFRKDIKAEFRKRTVREQRLMRDQIPNFHPKVNQTYPSTWPLATVPPTLLATLPILPEGLEYRLLSDAMIVRDVKANIIVDFILDVF